jgi:hypothetical protein
VDRQSVPVDHPGRPDNPEDMHWYRAGRQALAREIIDWVVEEEDLDQLTLLNLIKKIRRDYHYE